MSNKKKKPPTQFTNPLLLPDHPAVQSLVTDDDDTDRRQGTPQDRGYLMQPGFSGVTWPGSGPAPTTGRKVGGTKIGGGTYTGTTDRINRNTTVFNDNYNARPKCTHRGTTMIYASPGYGVQLYAANSTGITPSLYDVTLDCAKVTRGVQGFVKAHDQGYVSGLAPFVAAAQNIIELDWPDGSAPPVALGFWVQLWRLLQERGVKSMGVCCFGGHGRTGTALAALMIADGVVADSAIKVVRSVHCKRAIETQAQERYLNKLDEEAVKHFERS